MPRKPLDVELYHERRGRELADELSVYDTSRRVEILTRRFLTGDMVDGKTVLDVGCGLGYFSESLQRRGGLVTACDLGPGLVELARERANCDGEIADALSLVEHFGERRFDLVVSSECIAHTPAPAEALRQMAMVLKPGGYLAVSTPNRRWYPMVWLATALRLRPADGFKNLSSWQDLRRILLDNDVVVLKEYGLHLFPFQFGFHRLSTWCDDHLQPLRELMINICVLGRKRSDGVDG